MKKIVLLIFGLVAIQSFGQTPRAKDNPIQRQEFEILKLKNPVTGKIPSNIRKLELEFSSKLPAQARLDDATTTWNHRGPFNVGGRTRALAVSVIDENMILAGGVSGGLWRSTDQGQTWAKSTNSLELHSITCIAQDTRTGQTDTWYYGTGELSGNSAGGSEAFFLGEGVYKSTDNGVTWSVLSSTVSGTPEVFNFDSFQITNDMVVNPVNGDLLVGTNFGIQRSQDGGTSFSEVLDNSAFQGWSDIVTTTTGILFASLQGQGIFQSTDGGDNWTDITDMGFPISDGDRIELAIALSNENILYVISEDGTGHALWKFDDSVDSWTDLSLNLPMLGGSVGDFDSQGGYDLLIEVKPDDENFVIIGGTNLYRSTDGFSSTSNTDWVGGYSTLNNVSYYTHQHPDQHAFIFLSGTKALSGNDGGVQLTDDITDVIANGAGETVDWNWLNNGYLTTQVYALSVGPGDQIMSGFQDNSTWLSTSLSSTANWSDQLSGDGAYNAFNDDGTVRYLSSQNASIDRIEYTSADDESPNSFTAIDPTINSYATSLFITPFYLDPLNDELMYLGGDIDLFVNTQASSSDQTVGWKSISLGNVDVISEFGLTNSNMVYAGTASGELYKIINPESATPTITNVTGASFPTGYISSIGVNPFDESELVVTFSSYGIPSVFHSSDGGTLWTDIGGNLEEDTDGSGSGPSVRAVRLIGDSYEYYVGTSTGLYSTRDLNGSSTIWVQEGSSSIGNIVVNHIVTRDDGQIVVGTHGNGVYSAIVPFSSDLTISSLDAPSSMLFTSLSDVIVTLINEGGLPSTTFDLSLTVDNVLIVTDNITSSIEGSGGNLQHTFSTQVDFSSPGMHTIEVAVSANDDFNPDNDSLSESIISLAAPTDISLTNVIIPESQVLGTSVGAFSTTDLDDIAHTYSFVAGMGDDDNASFSINSAELLSAEVFDFETKETYLIRIQTADDDGNTFAKSFSIGVEQVTGIENLEDIGITMYPNPFKDRIYLEMVNDYIGPIEIKVLSLDGKKTLIEKSYDKRERRTNSLLDLSHISSGIYFIKFNLGGREISSKLIKD